MDLFIAAVEWVAAAAVVVGLVAADDIVVVSVVVVDSDDAVVAGAVADADVAGVGFGEVLVVLLAESVVVVVVAVAVAYPPATASCSLSAVSSCDSDVANRTASHDGHTSRGHVARSRRGSLPRQPPPLQTQLDRAEAVRVARASPAAAGWRLGGRHEWRDRVGGARAAPRERAGRSDRHRRRCASVRG